MSLPFRPVKFLEEVNMESKLNKRTGAAAVLCCATGDESCGISFFDKCFQDQ